MRTIVPDKYTLRDIHNEIDLIDRKLNHTLRVESFETEALREAAARKLSNKREQLSAQARGLVELGIELPETRTVADREASAAETAEAETVAEMRTEFGEKVAAIERENSVVISPLAAWQDDLEAYKRRRSRANAA